MADLSGQGPIAHTGATSVVDSVQAIAFGTRGKDAAGNEYVYCDFQESFVNGEWCSFDSSYKASQLGATSIGWVGIITATVSASDRFGWVQVWGVNTFAWATSGSSSGFPTVVAATTDLGTIATDGTSANSTAIFGVVVASSPDTCASTALSTSALAAPCTVLLNYPFISSVQISTS